MRFLEDDFPDGTIHICLISPSPLMSASVIVSRLLRRRKGLIFQPRPNSRAGWVVFSLSGMSAAPPLPFSPAGFSAHMLRDTTSSSLHNSSIFIKILLSIRKSLLRRLRFYIFIHRSVGFASAVVLTFFVHSESIPRGGAINIVFANVVHANGNTEHRAHGD